MVLMHNNMEIIFLVQYDKKLTDKLYKYCQITSLYGSRSRSVFAIIIKNYL